MTLLALLLCGTTIVVASLVTANVIEKRLHQEPPSPFEEKRRVLERSYEMATRNGRNRNEEGDEKTATIWANERHRTESELKELADQEAAWRMERERELDR